MNLWKSVVLVGVGVISACSGEDPAATSSSTGSSAGTTSLQGAPRKRSVFAYMRSGKEAARLNALRLEVMELSERTDNAIKFLSDMYWARVYKLAAARIGVPDYRHLVEQKLQAAGELYRFMIDTSHQGTAFVLETVVVIILIIDLIVLFAGKPH